MIALVRRLFPPMPTCQQMLADLQPQQPKCSEGTCVIDTASYRCTRCGHVYMASHTREQLQAAFDALLPVRRALLWHFIMQGLPYDRIAQLYGLDADAVARQIALGYSELLLALHSSRSSAELAS